MAPMKMLQPLAMVVVLSVDWICAWTGGEIGGFMGGRFVRAGLEVWMWVLSELWSRESW